MEEEVRICDYCGRVLAEEEGTPVDDELLCDDCVEEHCVTCDHCGETIWEQNSVSDEDTCLCQDCFDAHYYRCESCGQIVPESIVCWHGDLPYCERCFDEFEDEIEEYGYKPTPIFYGQGKRYFGVELEGNPSGGSLHGLPFPSDIDLRSARSRQSKCFWRQSDRTGRCHQPDPVLCGKALERVVHIQPQKQLQHEPLECKIRL